MDFPTMVVMLILSMPIYVVAFLMFLDALSTGKSKVLYFETEKTARFINKKVKEGFFKIGKKSFYADNADPPLVRAGGIIKHWKPLYICKWDRALTLDIGQEGLKAGQSPDNISNTMSNKTLDVLLTQKKGSREMIIYLILGGVMGGLIGYIIATNIH